MILQTAVFWLYQAILSILARASGQDGQVQPHPSTPEGENSILRRLELLAKKQLELAERGLQIAESINAFADRLDRLGDDQQDIRELAPSFHGYAVVLFKLFTAMKEADDRAIVLTMAAGDQNLQAKLTRLYNDMILYIHPWLNPDWSNPLSCMVAVSKKCHVVTCPTPEDWALYPDYAWGCFNLYDKCWVEDIIEHSGDSEECTYVHPLRFVSKMNVPNYFYWACVLEPRQSQDTQLLAQRSLIDSIVAIMSEEDRDSTEDNSSTPSLELWGSLKKHLPAGIILPVSPVRPRETVWDVMAGKEQIYSVQMMLMQLTGEQE